ncbi:MAG TPA: endonuclease/exonuclease/phosphatase family protein [Phycisphaerae bacterium]|nr:endonuclease/exonuclease/phosphatase family protein [Phycisphaerae bacterium]
MAQTDRASVSPGLILALLAGFPAAHFGAERLARADSISVCSFNIQFVGQSYRRRDSTLAEVVRDHDIVVVQEIIAPPFPGKFPDGTAFEPDPQTGAFFGAMTSLGFDYWLSEEDTGTGDDNHDNGPATEWWAAFYKKEVVNRATDLPHGFLADDRTNHPDFERVPYAFSFRSQNGNLDFVLISVHLKPDAGTANENRRKHELSAIATWIDEHDDGAEKDFIILGDMNIQSQAELEEIIPDEFTSLNDECRDTATSTNQDKPYDHVMFRPAHTSEIDAGFDLKVINLIDVIPVMNRWNDNDGAFPGKPTYDHDRFRAYFSDHHPVSFRLTIPADGDD